MQLGNFILATLAKSSVKIDVLYEAIKKAYYPNGDWLTVVEFEESIHNNTIMATDFLHIASLLKLDISRLLYYSDIQSEGIVVEASKKKVLETMDIYKLLLKESVYLNKGVKYELSNVLRIRPGVFRAYYENESCSKVAMEEVEQLGEQVQIKGLYFNDDFGAFLRKNASSIEKYKSIDLNARRKCIRDEGELLHQLYPDKVADYVKTMYI